MTHRDENRNCNLIEHRSYANKKERSPHPTIPHLGWRDEVPMEVFDGDHLALSHLHVRARDEKQRRGQRSVVVVTCRRRGDMLDMLVMLWTYERCSISCYKGGAKSARAVTGIHIYIYICICSFWNMSIYI